MEGPPEQQRISGDECADALERSMRALNPAVAEDAAMELLRLRLLSNLPPLTLMELKRLKVIIIGNDPCTNYMQEGMGLLGASHGLTFYLEGMALAFKLTKEEAMELARGWTHLNICPTKRARLADMRLHVAKVVLPALKAQSEQCFQGDSLYVFGYGAWPDTLQSLQFESAELRSTHHRHAKVETHDGKNIVDVTVKNTPIRFIYGGYPHPGSGGEGWAKAFAPLYAKFLRDVFASRVTRHEAIACPSALREAYGLAPATKEYFHHDDDEVAACDDDDDDEVAA